MTPRSRQQANADAEAARQRAPITDRVNVEPAILNGMTLTEAKVIGSVSFVVFMLIGALLFSVTHYWQFMLVLGILPGALIASLSDRSFKLEAVPPLWQRYFGPSIGKRALAAFFGGIVAMIGARLADGCPSGHGLSGLMQLSASSFVAMACFFGIGIVVASLIYKGRRP